MQKHRIMLYAVGFLALISLTSLAQAASSTVYVHQDDKYAWKVVQTMLDADMKAQNSTTVYRMMEILDLNISSTQIMVNYSILQATQANYDEKGIADSSIWNPTLRTKQAVYLKDGETVSQFQNYFNTMGSDLTQLGSLPAQNKTNFLIMLTGSVNDQVWSMLIGMAFLAAFDIPLYDLINTTEITASDSRSIEYTMSFSFSALNSGKWSNITVVTENKVSYGKDSAILFASESTSEITQLAWDSSSSTYKETKSNAKTTYEVVYPSEIAKDVPPEQSKIDGYSMAWIGFLGIFGAMIVLVRVRKIRN